MNPSIPKSQFETAPISLPSQQDKVARTFRGLSFESTLTEWGLPHGGFGRIFPLLSTRGRSLKTLWITDQEHMLPYPKLIHNLGLNLCHFHFVHNPKPLKNLKPLFTENVYKQIVLDTSEFFRPGDLSFLAQLARKNQCRFSLVRHFFLSPKRGNPFAKNRMNVSFSLQAGVFSMQILKGSHPQRVSFSVEDIFQ